eukprot:TRINITY_DN9573_c0_g1_i1.p1 TRINITY_DN9573_c0_g1~~TRINITY_DN9573_c0_g1_i1.p1  ORF type:complete len:105 (-),score=9.00 TRINITY_DN9573_c0_g1_i1:28-342(-)
MAMMTMNLAGFLVICNDKSLAIQQQSRISELRLLACIFIAPIGSCFGCLVSRHKTSKKEFMTRAQLVVTFRLLLTGVYIAYWIAFNIGQRLGKLKSSLDIQSKL